MKHRGNPLEAAWLVGLVAPWCERENNKFDVYMSTRESAFVKKNRLIFQCCSPV